MATNSAAANPIIKRTAAIPARSKNPTINEDLGQHILNSKAEGAQTEKEAEQARSEKESRERKKREKQAKFDPKKGKATIAIPTLSANKEKKASKAEIEALPLYVEDTLARDKKSIKSFDYSPYKAYNLIAVESAWGLWLGNGGVLQA